MEGLSLGIFVVPVLALTLVILGYLHFAKMAGNRQNYRKYIITIAITSLVLNLIWEISQGPLYEGYEYDWKHISFCALASIPDMLMVLLLLFGFGMIYKDLYWIKGMGAKKVFLLALAGFSGAILAEVFHTIRGDWSYAKEMPLLPLVDIGLSPVLQFTILPWLIFLICAKLINEKNLEM